MLDFDVLKKNLMLWVRKKKKRKKCETDFIIIPRGKVSQLQVLDMVVNESFDNHLKIICRMKGFVISTWILWFFRIWKNSVKPQIGLGLSSKRMVLVFHVFSLQSHSTHKYQDACSMFVSLHTPFSSKSSLYFKTLTSCGKD